MGGRGGGSPATNRIIPITVASPADQVRAAYQSLASEQGAWVSLARLRDALPGMSRQEQDRAIKSLYDNSEDVNIVPENNQKSLTQAQRDAALRFGGQDKHLISIFRI